MSAAARSPADARPAARPAPAAVRPAPSARASARPAVPATPTDSRPCRNPSPQIVRAVGLEEIPHPHYVGVIELGQSARFVQKGLQPDLEQRAALWRVRGQGASASLPAHQLARSVGPRAGSTRPSHAAPDPARCLCVVRVAAYFAGTILQSVRGAPGKAADGPPPRVGAARGSEFWGFQRVTRQDSTRF